jgi:uncharacterized Zn finger protein
MEFINYSKNKMETAKKCPNCGADNSADELIVIKSKHRKAKIQGFSKEDYLPISLKEYGCRECGIIFFDPVEFQENVKKQLEKRSEK